jgi:HAD superfamily hydrolase (TIGR01509 family)
MISNVGKGFIERMFVDKPAEYYFDSIVLSSEVRLVKPDVRIYRMCASKLGVDEQNCVFVDDSITNVEGAIKAGMAGIQYKNYTKFMTDINNLLYKK